MQFFKDALENTDTANESSACSDLSYCLGGSLKLQLKLAFWVLGRSWSIGYKIPLKSVSVERIDIVESRLRDLQDAVDKMTPCVAETTRFFPLNDAEPDRRVVWKPDTSSTLCVTSDGKSIKTIDPGLYAIVLETAHVIEFYKSHVVLLKNGDEMFRNASFYAEKNTTTSTSTWVLRLSKGDIIEVRGEDIRILSSSKMMVTKLAN